MKLSNGTHNSIQKANDLRNVQFHTYKCHSYWTHHTPVSRPPVHSHTKKFAKPPPPHACLRAWVSLSATMCVRVSAQTNRPGSPGLSSGACSDDDDVMMSSCVSCLFNNYRHTQSRAHKRSLWMCSLHVHFPSVAAKHAKPIACVLLYIIIKRFVFKWTYTHTSDSLNRSTLSQKRQRLLLQSITVSVLPSANVQQRIYTSYMRSVSAVGVGIGASLCTTTTLWLLPLERLQQAQRAASNCPQSAWVRLWGVALRNYVKSYRVVNDHITGRAATATEATRPDHQHHDPSPPPHSTTHQSDDAATEAPAAAAEAGKYIVVHWGGGRCIWIRRVVLANWLTGLLPIACLRPSFGNFLFVFVK